MFTFSKQNITDRFTIGSYGSGTMQTHASCRQCKEYKKFSKKSRHNSVLSQDTG